MAPKHKESECASNLDTAVSRVHQIDVNLSRAAVGLMKWSTAIRRSQEASAEAIRILRRQQQLYRSFARAHRAAPVWKQKQDKRTLELWYRSARYEIEDMKGQKRLIDGAAELYQDQLYHPFLQTHRNEPHHPVWALNERLSCIELLLQELREVAGTASALAEELEDRYTTSMWDARVLQQALPRNLDPEAGTVAETLWVTPSTRSDADAAHDMSSDNLSSAKPSNATASPRRADETPAPFITTFSPVDEKVKHKRAATTANYLPTGPPTFGSVFRRQGRSVPRIFTGSFSELEESLREMTTDGSGAQIDLDIKSVLSLPIKGDLATVSASFPVVSKRRPSLEEEDGLRPSYGHDADDVVMVSRRRVVRRHPDDRVRAQTLPVNDPSGALNNWLKERQPQSRHRDNTA